MVTIQMARTRVRQESLDDDTWLLGVQEIRFWDYRFWDYRNACMRKNLTAPHNLMIKIIFIKIAKKELKDRN